jgi:hypothetical protein
MKLNSIRIEEGVIVGCIVALAVGAVVWIWKYLELERQQRADQAAL